jgi:hypothetical protein
MIKQLPEDLYEIQSFQPRKRGVSPRESVMHLTKSYKDLTKGA